MKVHEHETKRIINGLVLDLAFMTRNTKVNNTKVCETNKLPALVPSTETKPSRIDLQFLRLHVYTPRHTYNLQFFIHIFRLLFRGKKKVTSYCPTQFLVSNLNESQTSGTNYKLKT